MPIHKERKGKYADKATDLAHGRSNTVTGGSNFYGKDLRRIDEGRGIWSELRKKVAEAIDDEKGVDHLGDIGNEGEQAKAHCHHGEAEDLNSLAPKPIH